MSAHDERGLSTARAVLRLLNYVARHPRGVTAREVADTLGRSVSTAYHLLEKPMIRHTAHALAIGKLALAGLDEEQLQRYEDESGLRSFTSITVTDPWTLRRELAEVRRRGVASDRYEYDVGLGCFAAPVHGADGRPIAALAMTVTRAQFAAEREELESNLLGDAHARPSAAVGARRRGPAISVRRLTSSWRCGVADER